MEECCIFYDFKMRFFFLAKKKDGDLVVIVRIENETSLLDEFGSKIDESILKREATPEEYLAYFNFRGVSTGNKIAKFGYKVEEILEVEKGDVIDPQPIVRTTPKTKVYPDGHSGRLCENRIITNDKEKSLIEYGNVRWN